MSRILVTNDDGVRSPGLRALAEAMAPLGDVVVVAPQVETSAIGHAVTLQRPLRLIELGHGWHAVDGTPTDCVNLAIIHVLHGLPDLVVSGINLGLNLGDDVTYSGTVAGALEAALFGVSALAISVDGGPGGWRFDAAAEVAARLARAVLASPLPPRMLLNLNVPDAPPKGLRVTIQGNRQHGTTVAKQIDPRGRPYYWVGLSEDHWVPDPRSDVQAIRDGFVSVTPLRSDMTAYDAIEAVEGLSRAI